MRPMEVTFPEHAEKELKELLSKEKDVRIFKRTQAILKVVQGSTLKEASETFRFAYSALRKWIHRYVNHGVEGLKDLPRSGRPTQITPEIEDLIVELLEEDPLLHGSIYSQWTCSELGRIVGEKTGVFPNRETTRVILKKKGLASTDRPSNSVPTPKRSPKRKKKSKR